MPVSRTLCSKGLCHFGTVARGRGPVACFNSLAHAQASHQDTAQDQDVKHPRPQQQARTQRRPVLPRTPRRQRPKRLDPGKPDDDAAISLFKDVVDEAPGAAARGGKNRPLTTPALELAATIASLNRGHAPAAERLRIFKCDMWPSVQSLKWPLPKPVYMEVNRFLTELVKDLTSGATLTPGLCLTVADMWDWLAKVDLRSKCGLILNICLAIANEKDASVRDALVTDLADMWRSVSLTRRPHRGPKLRFWLPDRDHVEALINSAARRPPGAARWSFKITTLSSIFNQFPTSHGRYAIPALLTSLVIWSDEALVPRERLADVAPLLRLAQLALSRCGIDDDLISQIFNDRDVHMWPDKLQQSAALVRDSWPRTMKLLMEKNSSWDSRARPWSKRPKTTTNTLPNFHKLLRSAYATDNVGVKVSLWKQLRRAMDEDNALVAEIRQDPEFMDFWHFVWCAARREDMLRQVEDVMREIGLSPTIKTYTAMMHGWKLSREADKIDSMWSTLIEHGVPLDMHAWTERISGLIELGQPQKGIETLAELLSKWKKAVELGQEHTAVQPTIEAVNAALKPLIRIDTVAAHEILRWAEREGIRPNILTYNILLRECFRGDGSGEEVQAILRTMKEHSIEPDAATFTILLEDALGNLRNAPADEQVAAVDNIIADIRAAKVQPNLETYGKMLYAVASLSDGADAAVESVLSHMRSTGHTQISPHMILILINRLMDRGNPTSSSIHDLLQRHGFTSVQAGDQRLWEHVLSAYSILGDTERALALYDELRRQGRPVIRQFALRDLLLALVEEQNDESARRIVNEAIECLAQENIGERSWRHHFWHQAYKFGLLDWDTSPADLRREVDEGRFLTDQHVVTGAA